MKRPFIIVVAAFAFSSCATIFSGTTAQVTVTSPDAQRVELIVDGQQYGEVTLPTQVTVKRGFSSSSIKAIANGYEGEAIVRKTFNEVGLVNILLGGIPGLIVDCATGAITKPDMASYTIYLNYEIKQYSHVTIPFRPAESE